MLRFLSEVLLEAPSVAADKVLPVREDGGGGGSGAGAGAICAERGLAESESSDRAPEPATAAAKVDKPDRAVTPTTPGTAAMPLGDGEDEAKDSGVSACVCV